MSKMLTKRGVVVEIRKDGNAAVLCGVNDWVYTSARDKQVGEEVLLIYVKSASYGLWQIAQK